MKKLILLAGIVALAGCSEAAPEAPATPAPEATTAAVDPMETAAGDYTVTNADGTKMNVTISADGTYVDILDGKEAERGTYARVDGKSCFTKAGETEAMCWTDAPPAADGSWTATADDGTTVTVMRVAAAGAAAPAPAMADAPAPAAQ